MNNLKRRVENLEKQAGKSEEKPSLLIIHKHYEECPDPPEPVREWITFKRAVAESGDNLTIFMADPRKEIKARQELQEATKGNGSEG